MHLWVSRDVLWTLFADTVPARLGTTISFQPKCHLHLPVCVLYFCVNPYWKKPFYTLLHI